MSPLYVFDVLGTFAFAVYGAYVAQNKRFDVFGVFVCAFVSAVGGGTIREMLLNRLPVYFFDPAYIIAIVCGMIASILLFHRFEKIQRFMLSIDALGLATFAFLGAAAASAAGLGVLGAVLFAMVSAVGGGVLRDVMVREVPIVLYQDFYATPAALLGFGYIMLRPWMENPVASYSLIAIIFCLRLVAIKFRFRLWKPRV